MPNGYLESDGKFGAAWASYHIDEGGYMGPVAWYIQVPYFDSYGNPKTKAQLNADVLAELNSQRSNQGATAIPDPALNTVDFFPDF